MTGITKFHKNLGEMYVNHLDESVHFSKLHLQITSNFTVTARKRKTGNVGVTQH